ncbi:hypothetical protein GPECTOR_2g1001 [Gonium pectorale]|uniref:Sugar phosphate transporter domain-containing protein n=1 Tax=Gonium pectorale TaxID=33097 RepID=A0A150H0E5_GONPE|nr:hypothetical protein GPECTOR_2g1001 [Gonium pectorale]|eukprot:KXZ55452.1 hypothetical protein GPECTOR_2g1001 [Gonium pectorale]
MAWPESLLPQRERTHSELLSTLYLGSLFAGWYVANIAFNLYNKQVLKAFPFPVTVTEVQFLVGSAVTLAAWASGLLKAPRITAATVRNVLPLALVHTLGNLLTNMSLGAVAVSFTHTIKAMEPFFSVFLSAMFLGEQPSPAVLLTLLPIVGGVAVASMTEASFNWYGFLSAMGSNLTFQSRNVLSKKLMLRKGGEGALDNTNLFCCITLLSTLLLMPACLLLEGWQMTPAGLSAMGARDPGQVLVWAALAGLCFHAYQTVSYMILQRVSPVTHSIGNCVKRVVVIAASVVFFRNPVSLQNALGTALALAGVFAYGQVKRKAGKKAAAE